MTNDATTPPLGTKRHVGRTGPRVDPRNELSTLIRFAREFVGLSRPQLCKLLPTISVASLHTLEHERAPRDGELDELLPVLQRLVREVDADKWAEFGGNAFLPIEPARAPRKRAPKAKPAAEAAA